MASLHHGGLCLALCIVSVVIVSSQSAPSPKRFSFGTIEGFEVLSEATRRPLHAYYGIPYAQPPVGALRFLPPVKYAGNIPTRVISASSLRAACLQAQFPGFDLSSLPKSEDCLHLNIYTPVDAANVPGTSSVKKVMVWIHGGGYTAGDAQATVPTDLVADYDVIVVTLHYRLGFFGFVSTGDAAAPGNNGLRDQLMAIQWVKDNIREFGGDPDDLTIFGESAGAGSVSTLSLSPYSKGLFTKAIMQSGTALSPWCSLTPRRARENFYTMARRLNCMPWWSWGSSETYHKNILNCLRNKPAESIESFADNRYDTTELFSNMLDGLKVAPAVDGDVLPGDPKALLANADYLQRNGVSDRSYIAGTTNDEGRATFYGQNATQFLTDRGMRLLAKYASKTYYPSTTNDETIDLIDFIYSYPRQADGRPSFQSMKNVQTDINFVFPTVDFLNRLTKTSPTTNTYLYLFDHYPDLEDKSLPRIATDHAWDLLYLFDQVNGMAGDFYQPKPDITTADSRAMTDVFRGVLTQFAKTGNPSITSTGFWARYDLANRQFMNLSPQPQGKMGGVYPQRISLWSDFLSGVATNLFAGRRGWF